jgi:putative efflux protein, MATE family
MTRNMTSGSPIKHIIGFTIPLLLGNLFQQLYTMIDTVIVGRTLGADALGSVGATTAVSFLTLGFCLGISAGFCIPVAQNFGAEDYKALRRFVGNIIWLLIFFSAGITVLTVSSCRTILEFIGTPKNIFEGAYGYLLITFIGIPSLLTYNTASGIMRSLGDSRTPLFFLILSSFMNIGLDFLFILVFNLGVPGAALATVLSQTFACVGCIVVILRRYDVLRLTKNDLKIRRECIKSLLLVGVPMGLQYSITGIGNVVLQSSVNALGSVYVAAMTAGSRISLLFICANDSLGAAMATYSSQNIGAGKVRRVQRGMYAGVTIGLIYFAVSFITCFFVGKSMIAMFLENPTEQIIQSAHQYLLIGSFFWIPHAVINIFRLLIQGLGYSRLAMCAGILEMIARGSIGFFFVPTFGFIAVCFSGPAAWVLADIFLVPAYFIIMKKLKRTIPDTETALAAAP